MKFSTQIAAAFLVVAAVGVDVTPVQQVIKLLNNMAEKGKKEAHEEKVQFAAYKSFCDSTRADKTAAIKQGEEDIDMLNARIAKNQALATTLATEVAGHEADIAAWEGDISAATKVRKMEKADYDALHKDYSETVDACGRAIQVLKDWGKDRKQAPAPVLAQLSNLQLFPAEARKTLDLFLVQENELAAAAPEAYGYEFQSHDITAMLEKLKDKFIQERTSLEKDEVNAVHAFEMLIQQLTAEIATGTTAKTDKTTNKAKAMQSKADAEGDLGDTTATLKSDQEYLGDLVGTCQSKATDFEARQQLRAEEIEAIGKATEILSGSAVSGNAETYLAKTALAQFLSSAANPAQQRAAQFLQEKGKHLHSRVLAALAVRVVADPFGKVKKMIKDLITRLLEETNEEATHKGWCDTELTTNKQTRDAKTAAVETLHAEIDEAQATVAKLAQEIADHTEAINGHEAANAKATADRQASSATNKQTLEDAQEAQVAVGQAIVVLKEFYGRAGEATAFAQLRQPEQPVAPEIFDSPYKGMQSENGGVIGMLEVISADFARLEADTKSSEESDEAAYQKFMTEGKTNLAQYKMDVEHKSQKKTETEKKVQSMSTDLVGTDRELTAALAYYDKLKPSCIDAGVSFEDRSGRRKEEIESLQEALRILNGEDLA